MDKSVVSSWSDNMDVNPKDLQLNHMTLPKLPNCDGSLRAVRSSPHFCSDFGNLGTDLLSFAELDANNQIQDLDTSVSTQSQFEESDFQPKTTARMCRPKKTRTLR